MEIWILGKRGVNVPMVGAIKSRLELEPNIHVLDCKFKWFKGLTNQQWAEMWLHKRNNRPAKVLTCIHKPAPRTAKCSHNSAKKEFRFQATRKRSAKNPYYQLY